MRTNWCVNPAVRAIIPHYKRMQRFSHPMKPLKLIGFRVVRHMQNGCDSMGVVGRKLRVNPVGHAQQFARVRDVGHIGCWFACVDREAVDAIDLRQFHFGIPVGTFDQPHHDTPIQTL